MILLIADTPVAGTISRLAHWIARLSGLEVIPVIFRNYPNNSFQLPSGAFKAQPNWESTLKKLAGRAKAIFVHNIYSDDPCWSTDLDLVFEEKHPSCRVYFQCHSPPNEPPSLSYAILRTYPFDHVFAVAQGHGRFLPEATSVPNIVPDWTDGIGFDRSDIVFIPHLRVTNWRWSSKITAADIALLKSASGAHNIGSIRDVSHVFGRASVSYNEIRQFLFSSSAVIDDIRSGLIHQTTIEGLKSGCRVFSAADMLSMEEYCNAVDCPPLPIDYAVGGDEVVEILQSRSYRTGMIDSRNKINEFAGKFLTEERLAKQYYKSVSAFLA